MSRAEGSTSLLLPQTSSKKTRKGSRNPDEQPEVPLLILDRYRVRNLIGSGSFGYIFEADDTETHEQFAVKFESQTLRYPQLLYEARVLKLVTGFGIPKVIWFVRERTCRS